MNLGIGAFRPSILRARSSSPENSKSHHYLHHYWHMFAVGDHSRVLDNHIAGRPVAFGDC